MQEATGTTVREQKMQVFELTDDLNILNSSLNNIKEQRKSWKKQLIK